MTSITITAIEAAVIDSEDGSAADSVARELRSACQAMADTTGKTCEIYHPDGYVWDARSPAGK